MSICTECGRDLPPSAPGGICPACLLSLAVAGAEGGAHDPTTLSVADDSEERSAEAIGSTIGRYRLLEQIGEGGFGVVYMAEQREPVSRKVALKIIKLGMDTKQVIARFESERQALALMDHPNIARVLDAGTTQSGRPYFVMELVRGVPIIQFANEYRLSTRERLRLFVDVCAAVQHAHQKGIIHRDLKPSNVLVTMNDDRPMPKIIDFGIAKATAHKLTDRTLFTQFHQFIGTPAYMSPEQAQLNNQDVDTRSDIYALGVLLYELLTGTTPFDIPQLSAEGQEAVFRSIREDDPERPSTRLSGLTLKERTVSARQRGEEPKQWRALLRGDLDRVVMKSLEKDRTRRYDTAAALAQDIRRYLKNEPVLAVSPSSAYRFRKLVQRHRLATLAGGSILLSLVLGLGTAVVFYTSERDARVTAETQRRHADEARQLAEEAQEEKEAQRQLAEAKALEARQLLYASDMKVAHVALGRGDSELAITILEAHRPNGPEERDMRGWEWRYLYGQLHEGLNIANRIPIIGSVAVSADGNQVAVAGYAAEGLCPVEIVDPTSLELEQTLEPCNTWPPGMWFSRAHEHPTLVVETSAGVMEYDLAEGSRKAHRREGAFPLKLTPDAQFLVGMQKVGPSQMTLACWSANHGPDEPPLASTASAYALPDEESLHMEVRISPDSKAVSLSCADRTLRLFSLPELEEKSPTIGSLPGHAKAVAWSPDSKTVATGYDYPYVVDLWDVASGRRIKQFGGGQISPCYDLAFSPDGSLLAFTGYSSFIRIWETATAVRRRLLLGSSQRSKIAFFPSGDRLVTGGTAGQLTLWEASAPGKSALEIESEKHPLTNLEYSLDGTLLASRDEDKAIRLFDARTGHLIRDFQNAEKLTRPTTRKWRSCIRFTPDRRTLVTNTGDGAAAVFDILTGEQKKRLEHSGKTVRSLDISANGQWIATAGASRSVDFWDAHSGERAFQISDDHLIHHVAFSPNPENPWFAYAGGGRLVLRYGEAMAERASVTIDDLHSIAFSPDGKILACGLEKSVRLLAVPSLEAIARIPGARDVVKEVSFSPCGSTLAIPCSAGFMQLWNLRVGHEVCRLLEPGDSVVSAAFSPDGKTLAVSTLAHGVRRFEAPPMDDITVISGLQASP